MPVRAPSHRARRLCRAPAHRVGPPRGTSAQRGYGYRWQKARAHYLRAHPLCKRCDAEDRAVAATVVDHVVPHRGDMALFWDPDNWQPLCKRHHDIKTATEDGGFGRASAGDGGRT